MCKIYSSRMSSGKYGLMGLSLLSHLEASGSFKVCQETDGVILIKGFCFVVSMEYTGLVAAKNKTLRLSWISFIYGQSKQI